MVGDPTPRPRGLWWPRSRPQAREWREPSRDPTASDAGCHGEFWLHQGAEMLGRAFLPPRSTTRLLAPPSQRCLAFWSGPRRAEPGRHLGPAPFALPHQLLLPLVAASLRRSCCSGRLPPHRPDRGSAGRGHQGQRGRGGHAVQICSCHTALRARNPAVVWGCLRGESGQTTGGANCCIRVRGARRQAAPRTNGWPQPDIARSPSRYVAGRLRCPSNSSPRSIHRGKNPATCSPERRRLQSSRSPSGSSLPRRYS